MSNRVFALLAQHLQVSRPSPVKTAAVQPKPVSAASALGAFLGAVRADPATPGMAKLAADAARMPALRPLARAALADWNRRVMEKAASDLFDEHDFQNSATPRGKYVSGSGTTPPLSSGTPTSPVGPAAAGGSYPALKGLSNFWYYGPEHGKHLEGGFRFRRALGIGGAAALLGGPAVNALSSIFGKLTGANPAAANYNLSDMSDIDRYSTLLRMRNSEFKRVSQNLQNAYA